MGAHARKAPASTRFHGRVQKEDPENRGLVRALLPRSECILYPRHCAKPLTPITHSLLMTILPGRYCHHPPLQVRNLSSERGLHSLAHLPPCAAEVSSEFRSVWLTSALGFPPQLEFLLETPWNGRAQEAPAPEKAPTGEKEPGQPFTALGPVNTWLRHFLNRYAHCVVSLRGGSTFG